MNSSPSTMEEDQQQQGRRRKKRKVNHEKEEEENETTEGVKTTMIDSIPDDVIVAVVSIYLTQQEIVGGLSETCKYYFHLCKNRIAVSLSIFPFEKMPSCGWKNITGVRFQTTPWRGMSYDEFTDLVKKDENGYFAVIDLKKRLKLEIFVSLQKTSFSKYDVQGLQIFLLKSMEFDGVSFDLDNLKTIQSLETIESLSFHYCNFFESSLGVFPSNLKKLIIQEREENIVRIGNLPQTLKYLDCSWFELMKTNDQGSILSSDLEILKISSMRDENGKEIENLPFEFPTNLKELKVSKMYQLRVLPFLYHLNSLESFELDECALIVITGLPSSLRKMKIRECFKLETLDIPNNLEELECLLCLVLEIDMLALPPRLKKLSIESCPKMRRTVTQIEQFPIHLQQLKLDGLFELTNLPDLPVDLHSLFLGTCSNLTSLPALPQTLRNLELVLLINLENIPSLPEDLKYLLLSNCEKLKTIDQLPRKLKSLKLQRCLVNSKLPEMLDILEIRDCPMIKIDFVSLPQHLEVLKLEDLSEIESIPPLPLKLKTLGLRYLENLKVLPSFLPASLECFVIWNCNSIKLFPVLPSNLNSLYIYGCNQIEFIGLENESKNKIGIHEKLPDSLSELSLGSCSELKKIGDLPLNLRDLRIVDCYSIVLSSLPRTLRSLGV